LTVAPSTSQEAGRNAHCQIEEKLLATLSAKHDLALAALDMESDVKKVALASGIEELKRRLEVLLGANPHAAVDESEKQRQQKKPSASRGASVWRRPAPHRGAHLARRDDSAA
jgi:hypothetical protein